MGTDPSAEAAKTTADAAMKNAEAAVKNAETAAKVAATAAEQLTLATWAKHEEIAMHFNDLSMRLRVQALAGVGAAALVAGTIFSSKEGFVQATPLGLVLVAMALIWKGIERLDVDYYQRMLVGAVIAIIELEKASSLQLSTRVRERVGYAGIAARGFFYNVVFGVLFVGGIAFVLKGLGFLAWAGSLPGFIAVPGCLVALVFGWTFTWRDDDDVDSP